MKEPNKDFDWSKYKDSIVDFTAVCDLCTSRFTPVIQYKDGKMDPNKADCSNCGNYVHFTRDGDDNDNEYIA